MAKIRIKKVIVEICRALLGLVFVFSGFVKAVDPWGSAFKNLEYFAAFDMHVTDSFAIIFAFIQIAAEFAIGVCLLLGIYRRYSSFLALLFMIVMTPLTLYLAIANPVTDCGCFGDALVITNWQTFCKNLFLLAAAIVLCRWCRSMTSFFTWKSYSLSALWIVLFIVGFSFYCYIYLPIIDFRPYKIGANIPQQMEFPEDAEQAVYKTTFTYAKNGKQQQFSIDNYPKGDDWTFVNSESKLIKKGYEPPIHGFSITDKTGDDVTDKVLSDTAYTFLLIGYKLEKADETNVDKINEIYDFSKKYGYGFMALTASLSDEIDNWISNTGAEYSFYTVDDIALKTIIRSNPGLLLIKKGTIINKWPNRRLPGNKELALSLEETALGKIPAQQNALKVVCSAFILIIPLGALFLFDFFYTRKNLKSKRKSKRKAKVKKI